MKSVFFVIIITILVRVEANWKLILSEEFNGTDLSALFNSDTTQICEGETCWNYIIAKEEVIDGTLTISDPQSNYLNRSRIEKHTGISNKFLKYGKYEIRAAQPKRGLIWTNIYLLSTNMGVDKWVTLQMMGYKQQDIIDQKMEYRDRTALHQVPTDTSLNDFHKYSVEVNEKEVIWKLDDKETFRQNVSTIFDQEPNFQISIQFGVGGHQFDNTSDKQFEESDCPSLIIDYIRYYEWTTEEITSDITENTVTRDEICKKVKIMIKNSN